jgi:hypothetical protein
MNPRTIIRSLPVVLTTAALVVPSVAMADALEKADRARDVVKIGTDEQLHPAPRNKNTDITWMLIRHRADRSGVKVQLRDLDRGTGFTVVRIRTPRRSFAVDLAIAPISSTPRLSINDEATGEPVRCPGRSFDIRRARDTFIIQIPRSCLGDPRWVRMGLGVATTAAGQRPVSYVDDALRTGFDFDTDLALSRRIHH